MRILVTGVAGFIGSRLAQWIIDNVPNAQVFGFDDLSTGFIENVPSGVSGDRCLNLQYDYVFHCAAFAAECFSPFAREHCFQQNIVATSRLLNRILNNGGCTRLVFISSLAVYGHIPAPYKETDTPVPQDPYGISKLASEMDIRCAGEQFGLDWTVLRLFNVYGPYQSLWSQHRNVFGIWMKQKLEGKPLTVFGDGSCERAFTYIDDILPTIWQAAIEPKAGKEVFNVGNERAWSIGAAFSEFCEVIGDSEFECLPARHEVQEARCDVSKAKRILGAQVDTRLSMGLQRMWGWAQVAWEKYPERRNQTGPAIELQGRNNLDTAEGMPTMRGSRYCRVTDRDEWPSSSVALPPAAS